MLAKQGSSHILETGCSERNTTFRNQSSSTSRSSYKKSSYYWLRSPHDYQTRFNSLSVRVSLLQKPVVQLTTDSISLIIQLVDISRASVIYTHDRPQRLCLSLALVRFVLGVSHLLRIVVEHLQQHK